MGCLSQAIAACKPSLLVPADDRALAHLHRLHSIGSDAERRLVERSLGSPEHFGVVKSRVRLVALARALGIAVPDDEAVTTPAGLGAWLARVAGPWVIKVDGAWAGHGVRVADTPEQAYRAFHELRRPLGFWTSFKRLLVNRDPFWLVDRLQRAPPEVSVQAHVKGWPGNLAMFCRDGEVIAATVAEVVASLSETGPSTIIRLVDRPGLVADAGKLARELCLTGFYGLDFMVEQATGRAVLIELNPRVTSLANLRGGRAGNLVAAAAAAAAAMGKPCRPTVAVSGAAVSGAAVSGDLVAHFPLALHWNRDDPRLASCVQDVPWDEPGLIAEMLRPTWPDRQILARILTALIRARGPQKLSRMLAWVGRKRGQSGSPATDGSGAAGRGGAWVGAGRLLRNWLPPARTKAAATGVHGPAQVVSSRDEATRLEDQDILTLL